MTVFFTSVRRKFSRSSFLAAISFIVLVVIGETIAKWWPYANKVSALLVDPSWRGSSIFTFVGSKSTGISFSAGWEFLNLYFRSIWIALVVGLIIAAGIDSLVPRSWFRKAAGSKGALGYRSVLIGGALSLPTMMCTCCSAPISRSMLKDGVPASTTMAYWIGNPLLNPAVVIFLALVGPWQWVVVRLVGACALVFGFSALINSGKGELNYQSESSAKVTQTSLDSRDLNAISLASNFVRSLIRFLVTLVPEYLLVVFLLGVFHGWLFPFVLQARNLTSFSIVIVAVIGTLLVIPTAGEIPVLLALLALGVSPVIIGTLIIVLPAISLPSMVMVGRGFGWKKVGMLSVATSVCGICCGFLLLLMK